MEFSDKKKAGLICTDTLKKEVLYKFQGRCFLCGIEEWRTKASHQMHRVIPGKDGGLYFIENVIPVCRNCHRLVEGKTFEQLKFLRHPSTFGETDEN